MRAVVAYLVAHPNVWSVNFGERNGFAFSPEDYNILCEGVESGLTGLAVCWIEYQGGGLSSSTCVKGRFFDAVNANRRRLQDKARAVYALTGSEAAAMRLIPWRDRAYRKRLVETTRRFTRLSLGEYTCMGQHHLRHGVDLWGAVGGEIVTVEAGTVEAGVPVDETDQVCLSRCLAFAFWRGAFWWGARARSGTPLSLSPLFQMADCSRVKRLLDAPEDPPTKGSAVVLHSGKLAQMAAENAELKEHISQLKADLACETLRDFPRPRRPQLSCSPVGCARLPCWEEGLPHGHLRRQGH